MDDRVQYLERTILSELWGTFTLHQIRYRLRNGQTVELLREVYDHGSAVALLLLSPTRRKVLLTRQFRIAADLTGHHEDLLEVPAGLDGGEPAEIAARREAREETGIEVGELTRVFSCFMSPGAVTERVTGFIATYDRPTANHGGLADEYEEIDLVEIDYEAARRMALAGEIHDAKTLLLLQHALLTGLID